MTHKRRRHGRSARKPRPAVPPIRDPGPIRSLDSEDQSGTYAPIHSENDTGENDEGVFAQGPQNDSPSKKLRVKRRKEALR